MRSKKTSGANGIKLVKAEKHLGLYWYLQHANVAMVYFFLGGF